MIMNWIRWSQSPDVFVAKNPFVIRIIVFK